MTTTRSAAYTTVLLDLDHTLLDSTASEAAAFSTTVRSVGLEPTPELFDCYAEIIRALWAAVERGETTPIEVRLTRFERFAAAIDLVVDPEAMASTFTDGLGANGDLYPGVRPVLEQLSGSARLGLVTNGLSEVQRARIERLDLHLFFDAVVISAEVGVAKPGTEIFDIVFDHLDEPDRATTLMVGDSLTSDIQGGTNYGIDTCWYNPAGQAAGPDRPVPTHTIADLGQLPVLVGSD